MDSKVVNKAIREILKPVLKEHGFTEFTTRTARRYNKDTVDEMIFSSMNSYTAFGVGCTTYSFSLVIYVYFKAFENNQQNKNYIGLGKLYGAGIQKDLFKTLNQASLFHPYNDPKFHAWKKDRKEIWYVQEDGSNVTEVIEDAKKVILTQAVPWANKMTDIPYALKMIKTKDYENGEDYGGSLTSPHRTKLIQVLTQYIESAVKID